MNPNNLSVQCKLEKNDRIQFAWIPLARVPVDYARRPAFVELRDENGEWENGWLIREAHLDHALDSKFIQERTQDHKNMKKMTDI